MLGLFNIFAHDVARQVRSSANGHERYVHPARKLPDVAEPAESRRDCGDSAENTPNR